MKTLRYFLMISLLITGTEKTFAQAISLVGSWQLVKQSTCVDDDLEPLSEETEEVLQDMKAMSKPMTSVLMLKDNNTAEESTKIISRRKSYNSKSFLYRYNSKSLYFLDKRSKTIIEGYTVEKISADSLIITNSSRVCETKIFVRIK